jgi:hypothetical protein
MIRFKVSTEYGRKITSFKAHTFDQAEIIFIKKCLSGAVDFSLQKEYTMEASGGNIYFSKRFILSAIDSCLKVRWRRK